MIFTSPISFYDLASLFSSLSSWEVGKHLKKYLEENKDEKYIILFKGSQNTIFVEEALRENLSVENQKKLPRQSESWRKKKEEFFASF